jgi:hypothetical protein
VPPIRIRTGITPARLIVSSVGRVISPPLVG